MEVQRFVFNPFQENTYVLYDAVTKQCVVIDPECRFGAKINERPGSSHDSSLFHINDWRESGILP